MPVNQHVTEKERKSTEMTSLFFFFPPGTVLLPPVKPGIETEWRGLLSVFTISLHLAVLQGFHVPLSL